MPASIFFDFHLPNAATWFYFSLLLAVAIFFQFGRLLSLRNWDLLTLYLLVPGLLLLQEAHGVLAQAGAAGLSEADRTALVERGDGERLLAYVWLVAGSAYWFARCLVDLALVRRPALSPNLSTAGLGWLGLALLFCLTAVALRRPVDAPPPEQVGKRPIAVTQVQDTATEIVQQASTGSGQPSSPEQVRFWVERSLAMACHVAIMAALALTCARHFGDLAAGMGTATLYLILPYTAVYIDQLHHVWPTAFLMWAVYFYRRPWASGGLLGLASGTSFFPLLLFPLWASFYARRGAGRFTLAFLAALAVSAGIAALVLWSNGRCSQMLTHTLHLSDWQPWKVPTTESLWTGAHWAYRLPVFVLYVGLLAVLTVWPSPKNLGHLLALTGAVLIGVQFWYADRGGVYVLWYLPVLLLVVFRPNLSGHEAPPVRPGGGWLAAAGKQVARRLVPPVGGRRSPQLSAT